MSFDLAYALQEFSMNVQNEVVIGPAVDAGFKNFFAEKVYATKGFQFYVSRRNRPIAVDINPYEKGIVTSLDKYTQKNFIPPTFDYKVQVDAFDEFESMLGETGQVDGGIYKKLVEKTAREVEANLERFERREELQRAEALLTGIVTLKNGANIDFKRKAESLVPYNAAHNWADDTVNPEEIIIQLIEFLVKEGMVDASQPLDIVAGSEAYLAFKNNAIREKQGNVIDQNYMALSTQRPMNGLTPQGMYSAGNYRVKLWGYDGYYNDPTSGDVTSYMDSKKIIVLPNRVPFEMVYCGTKGWSDGTGYGKAAVPRVIKAKRNFYEVKDIEGCSKQYGVRTAFVASLREVDSVATAQVIAP